MNESEFTAENWEFAGWGHAEKITDLAPQKNSNQSVVQNKSKALGSWRATAICGNDITSSCLYVSALCAAHAGILAPIVLAIVAGVLYLFRKVYAEVGSALPLNGGCYTVLLNTTSKRAAAVAACLTILSYIATAVISANEAMHYARHLLPQLKVFEATIGLLAFFAFLNLVGISESAIVALIIFIFHMVTLTGLSIMSIWAIAQSPDLLFQNWSIPSKHNLTHALFFGFAAAMLGISGFESSANFIEEQQKGVFPKTLRNMWLAIAIFNPLLSFLSFGLIPLADIQSVPPDLLARMGSSAAGPYMGTLVSIDAVLVLSGAVLTSFVGVTGLMRRMTLDRCLPQILLKTNRLRGTDHWIILTFLVACISILFITSGNIETLAGVYTLSFLSVMALFAAGNILLKIRRNKLPRNIRASWPTVSGAFLAVIIGLAGNIILDPLNVEIFAAYFIGVGSIVALMFLRLSILRALLFVSKSFTELFQKSNIEPVGAIIHRINSIAESPIVYFTSEDDLVSLNRAILYVLQNEQTKHLKIIHVYKSDQEIPQQLGDHLNQLDHLYPQLKIDFVAVEGEFGPSLIDALSRRLNIPKNQMFIGTPGNCFPHELELLGGVRLIL